MSSNAHDRLITLNNELVRIVPYPWDNIAVWSARALPLIRRHWPDDLDDFRHMIAEPRWTRECVSMQRLQARARNDTIRAEDEAKKDAARSEQAARAKDKILSFLKGLLAATACHSSPEPLSILERFLDRFHTVVHQLMKRHADRSPLTIADEYDLQDLLHALLKLHFDDIRPEEWTPSYAGACARMDFLLKEEEIVVEVKKAGASLGAKEVGEQLLADIAKYRQHPDCKVLVCFVYDPEHRINNPVGLQRDLEKESAEGLQVVVCIRPA